MADMPDAPLFDTDKYASGYVPHYLQRVKAPRRILEVGVMHGGSLLLWCSLWPTLEAVIGIDRTPPVDCRHPKIKVFQVDQTDSVSLGEIATDHGPFDVIIDDASHIGAASWTTFRALWPHVTDNGIYVVEDWATGYWPNWPDGEQYHDQPLPGHTAGMVGMIKRLVDEVQNADVARLEILPDIAFAYKGRSTARG